VLVESATTGFMCCVFGVKLVFCFGPAETLGFAGALGRLFFGGLNGGVGYLHKFYVLHCIFIETGKNGGN